MVVSSDPIEQIWKSIKSVVEVDPWQWVGIQLAGSNVSFHDHCFVNMKLMLPVAHNKDCVKYKKHIKLLLPGTVFLPYIPCAASVDPDQPSDPCSLISTDIVCLWIHSKYFWANRLDPDKTGWIWIDYTGRFWYWNKDFKFILSLLSVQYFVLAYSSSAETWKLISLTLELMWNETRVAYLVNLQYHIYPAVIKASGIKILVCFGVNKAKVSSRRNLSMFTRSINTVCVKDELFLVTNQQSLSPSTCSLQ